MFTIPDNGEGVSEVQSILFQEDLDISIQDVSLGTYVKEGCLVTAQGSPNMTVAVAAGAVYSKGFRFPLAANASLAITTADATNPRIDYVVVTVAGALAVRAGVPAAYVAGASSPKPPNLTDGDVALAQVFVPAADTTISSNQIVDKRLEVPNIDMFLAEYGAFDNIFHALPSSGTTFTLPRGAGVTTSGTISHPQPATTNRLTQLWRTRFANVVTTANQILGYYQNNVNLKQFWRGNAANLGGFYFRGKMFIELFPAATIRYFCGLASSTTSTVASDTLAGDLCGLWHDAAMAASVLNFVTRDNTTTNTIAITLAANLAAGQGYELIMWCKPNDTILHYKVIDMLTGNTLAQGSTSTNLPRNTIFLGPEMAMSNGTANVTVTTTAPGILECFVGSPAIRT